MVERFDGRMSDLVKPTCLSSAADLDATLTEYLATCNHHIRQRALKHQSPIEVLQRWQTDRPEWFVKRFHKQTGLDIKVLAQIRLLRSVILGMGSTAGESGRVNPSLYQGGISENHDLP
jgi:hypothetical protein